MKIDESIISFAVYEDGDEFAGIAKATLPDLTSLTQSISGAGIAGNIEAVILGHFEAMTLALNFRTTNEYTIRLSEPRRHNLDMRVAQQLEDTVAGTVGVQAVKHVFVVVPKKAGGGAVAPATPGDGSGEYAVRYWATYIDGVLKQEIDPLNYVYKVNGIDYLSDVKRALGK